MSALFAIKVTPDASAPLRKASMPVYTFQRREGSHFVEDEIALPRRGYRSLNEAESLALVAASPVSAALGLRDDPGRLAARPVRSTKATRTGKR